MQSTGLELLVLAALVLGFPLWILPFVNARRRSTALRKLAVHLGVKFKPAVARFFGQGVPPQITGIYRNRQFIFSIARRTWLLRGADYFRRCAEVAVANSHKARFVLLTTTDESVILKSFIKGQRAQTGDEDFDRRFFIEKSVPADYATQLLASERQRQSLIHTLNGIERRRIELSGQRLLLYETMPWYRLEGSAIDIEHYQRLIDLAIDLAEAVEKIA